MPAPQQTPQQRALRLKGFELYLAGAKEDGSRRSIRSIAMTLGVTHSAVQYWRERDKWDQRVADALTQTAQGRVAATGRLSTKLRDTLWSSITILERVSRNESAAWEDRLSAIKELTNIAVRLKAINPDELDGSTAAVNFNFEDNLDGSDVSAVLRPAADVDAGRPDAVSDATTDATNSDSSDRGNRAVPEADGSSGGSGEGPSEPDPERNGSD